MDRKEISRFLSELTNTCDGDHRRILVEELRELHRTQQQVFTGMALAWINDLAENCRVDDRNRASHNVCRRLVELYRAETGEDKIKDKFYMV